MSRNEYFVQSMILTFQSKSEQRRPFLSTLAPLTACVGSASQHKGFYYAAAGDSNSGSSVTSAKVLDAPAPDVVAGTPGIQFDHVCLKTIPRLVDSLWINRNMWVTESAR